MTILHTLVSSVQTAGRPDHWTTNMIYIGMPGKAARAFGITDEAAGPFGKPWALKEDPRGWLIAYREYLWNRLKADTAFREAVRGLHGKTLLCWCTAKRTQRNAWVECHGDTLAKATEWLNHEEKESLS